MNKLFIGSFGPVPARWSPLLKPEQRGVFLRRVSQLIRLFFSFFSERGGGWGEAKVLGCQGDREGWGDGGGDTPSAISLFLSLSLS